MKVEYHEGMFIGKSIEDACSLMFRHSLDNRIVSTVNFNGIRILMIPESKNNREYIKNLMKLIDLLPIAPSGELCPDCKDSSLDIEVKKEDIIKYSCTKCGYSNTKKYSGKGCYHFSI